MGQKCLTNPKLRLKIKRESRRMGQGNQILGQKSVFKGVKMKAKDKELAEYKKFCKKHDIKECYYTSLQLFFGGVA